MAVCLCMMIRGVEDLQLTYEIVEKIEIMLRDNRRLIVDELSAMFPQISRSLLHETITETFGYRKLSARWVPKLHGDEFLRSMVTGDDPWRYMVGRRLSTEVKGEMEKWTKGLRANYFEEGIKKLIPLFTTCIERNGNYAEN